MRETSASSVRASRSALLISAPLPPFLASEILFSFLARTRISSKFSIGPLKWSCDQPTRSLLQLNLTTERPGGPVGAKNVSVGRKTLSVVLSRTSLLQLNLTTERPGGPVGACALAAPTATSIQRIINRLFIADSSPLRL